MSKGIIELRDATGHRRALLSPEADGLKDVTLNIRLNGECTLSFALPMTCEKWPEITTECRMLAEGREFVILRPDAVDVEREGQELWGHVTAQESWILLGKQHPTVPDTGTPLTATILNSDPGQGGFAAGSAGAALSRLLVGSGWTIGIVDVPGAHSLKTEKLSLLANIQKVQETWGGILLWDSMAKTVSLRAETWQNHTGFQVRYAKNLKHITRTTDNDLVTRLYPFGENDLDICAVNGGAMYLEDFSFTTHIYTGIYQRQDIADPAVLRDKAAEALTKLCRPRYTYRVGMVDLRTLPGYAHEAFALGDMVGVIDEDLGIDIHARLVRHKYDVCQPWKCELEIGEPEERLAAKLAGSIAVAHFVDNALRPNPGTSNLLKGFVNTFATQINSANGRLLWDDAALQAIEIDEAGTATGRRVRLTPGGIGISTDGGMTYATAMTGAGVLANRIIVSELFALSTEDGHTRLTGSGLEVWDNRNPRRKRLHAGQYAVGRFGLEVRDSTGNVVILDEDGILQSWQDSRADNVDSASPMALNVFVPLEARSVRRALLRFRLLPFRAYSTGAASGGGATSGASSLSTTDGGGGGTSGASSTSSTASGGGATSGASSLSTTDGGGGGTSGASSTSSTGAGTWFSAPGYASGFSVTSEDGSPLHRHALEGTNHSHGIEHTHTVPAHSHGMAHTHTVPEHSHGLLFGIFNGSAAASVGVRINGVDRTAVLGGPFHADQLALDVAPFLATGVFNRIELTSSQLGRLDATIFIQCMIGV